MLKLVHFQNYEKNQNKSMIPIPNIWNLNIKSIHMWNVDYQNLTRKLSFACVHGTNPSHVKIVFRIERFGSQDNINRFDYWSLIYAQRKSYLWNTLPTIKLSNAKPIASLSSSLVKSWPNFGIHAEKKVIRLFHFNGIRFLGKLAINNRFQTRTQTKKRK